MYKMNNYNKVILLELMAVSSLCVGKNPKTHTQKRYSIFTVTLLSVWFL